MHLLLPILLMGAGPELQPRLTSSEATVIVSKDLATLTPAQRLYTRYIYDSIGGVEWVKSQSANLNRVSRSYEVFQPDVLGNNRIIRVDLSKMVFNLDELNELLEIWENFRFDPTLNYLITDVKVFKRICELPEQPIAIIRGSGGFQKVPFKTLDQSAEVIRLTNLPFELIVASNSFAPLVEGHYFETRALSSIQEKGAFKVIWGGLYYQLLGIKKGKGETDESLFLKSLGISEDIFTKLRSEQRVALLASDVTGKPRQADFLAALNRRVGDGINGVSITHDVADSDILTVNNALMTLRKKAFKDKAREVVYIKANGFNGYVLFNNKGELQDEVPFDVANDTTIPNPHTKRLQAGISCIRCHEAAGHSGWMPIDNDVMNLLEKGAEIFGDVSAPDELVYDTLKELGSQYRGRPLLFLTSARNGFQRAMLDATGAWPGKPTDIITLTSKYLEKSYNDYNFQKVTPSRALKDLGFEAIPEEAAKDFIKVLLKPAKDSASLGILPEDVRIYALSHGIGIPRKDFAMIHAFAQLRAEKNRRNP